MPTTASTSGFFISGNATYLGSYTEVGSVTFLPTADPVVLAIDGRAIYTAANGDQLKAVITGQLNRFTGAITATVTSVSGGTGRFAGATGSANLVGQILPGGITVAVKGSIDY